MTFSTLGTDVQTGDRITLSQSARRQGTCIIGSLGTGKSGMIENLVIEDIKQGFGKCLFVLRHHALDWKSLTLFDGEQ